MKQIPSDKTLVKRLLRQDEKAFREFFDGYFPRLFRFVMARTGGDQDVSADVVQAALIKAVRKLGTWRGEAALFTWLCTICRRELSDYRRKNAMREQHELLTEDRPEVMAAVASLAATEAVGPEQACQNRELGRLIQVALDQLPLRYGDALEWKYVYGLSAREIARRLDLSVDAANSLLARARRAFRDAYGTLAESALQVTGNNP